MEREREAVMEAVRLFLEAYAGKDMEGCMRLVSRRTSFLMLGTNDDEVIKDPGDLKKALERDFSIMENIDFGEFRNQFVETDGKLATVILELPISYRSSGEDTKTLFRYALVLTNENKQWLICAGMTSVPFRSGTYSF
jgi:ketosteroid isomerase-like protein